MTSLEISIVTSHHASGGKVGMVEHYENPEYMYERANPNWNFNDYKFIPLSNKAKTTDGTKWYKNKWYKKD